MTGRRPLAPPGLLLVTPAPPVLATAWPRPAQLAAAFLLGAVAALLGVHFWGGGPPQPLDLRRSTLPTHAIELNHADRAEIRQLPGVGPTLAARIASARDGGGFRSLEDLRTVPGVGPARMERLRPWVEVDAEESAGMNVAAARSSSQPKKADALKDAIDVNRAPVEELQKLPGIGPRLAQRILDARAKSPFKSIEDLRRVGGIGPKTLEKLRPFVTVGEPE
jgi:competence protein ComEA